MVSATYNSIVSCVNNISGCVPSISTEDVSLTSIYNYGSDCVSGTIASLPNIDGTMITTAQQFVFDNAVPVTTTSFILLAGSYGLRRYGVPTILTSPFLALSSVPSLVRNAVSNRWTTSTASAVSNGMGSLSESGVQNAVEAAASWTICPSFTALKDAAASRVVSFGSMAFSSPGFVWGGVKDIPSHGLHFLSYSKGMIQSGVSCGMARASGWASTAFSYVADEKVKLASKGLLSVLGFGLGGYQLYSNEVSETQKLEKRIEDAEYLRSQILQKFGLNILDFSNYDEINNQLTAFQNHSTGCLQRKEAYDHVALRLNQKTREFFKGMSDQEKKTAVAFVNKPLDLNMGKPHDAAMQLKTVVDTLHDCHSLKAQDTEEISRLSNNIGKLTTRNEQCQKDLINAHNAIIAAKKEAIAVGCHAEFDKTRNLANAKTTHQVEFATCETKREICENELKSKGQGLFSGLFGRK